MCNMICEHCSWCDKLSRFGIKFYEDDFPLALDHTNSSLSINKRCVDHYAWLNKCRSGDTMSWSMRKTYKIAKFMGSTWGPPGSCRPHVGPMSLAIRDPRRPFWHMDSLVPHDVMIWNVFIITGLQSKGIHQLINKILVQMNYDFVNKFKQEWH